jgi:hypothetical protein
MATHRISIDIDEDEHKYLKMCCVKLGITIKDFVINATIEQVDSWEDKWMLERWERDGVNKELKADRLNPNRIVYELSFDGSDTKYMEKKYSEVEKRVNDF